MFVTDLNPGLSLEMAGYDNDGPISLVGNRNICIVAIMFWAEIQPKQPNIL